MTHSIKFFLIAVICVVLLGACGDSDGNNPVLVSLSEADNGKTVELRVIDKLDVTLTENPSTGFIWEIDTIDQTVINQIAQSEFTPGGGLGASGKRTFHFGSVAPGQSDLKLINHRPFDKNSPPASTFEVTVVVK